MAHSSMRDSIFTPLVLCLAFALVPCCGTRPRPPTPDNVVRYTIPLADVAYFRQVYRAGAY